MVLLQIAIFILILSFLVVIHELGHYLTARFFKVRVEEFGVGYPPRALTLFKRGKTLFSLNWIPFGGFVKMEGEEGSEVAGIGAEDLPSREIESVKPKHKNPNHYEGPFYEKTKIARLIITLAGATINLVFGVIAFSLFFSLTGIPELAPNPRVGEVIEGSPAQAANIPALVDIIAIEVTPEEVIPVASVDEVIAVISARPNQEVTVITTGQCSEITTECQEMAQRFPVTIRPKAEDATKGEIGVRFLNVVNQRFYPWYEMPFRGTWVGIQQTYYLSQLIFDALGNMGRSIFRGVVPQEVGSPVKIFVESKRAGIFDQGPWVLLNFAGIISVNLAIFNVLPIPALDGGRAFLILLEYVVGRKRVTKIEGYVNYAGFILLGSLMVVIFAKDIIEVIF
ncbi:site-2 protease family protein [Patescibacteria group bacterium]|nr:site-2 protease family protein [Patescibacteria group bacterium]